MMSLTDLHDSRAPHFKTFMVFLIYFLKCSSFSTIQSYVHYVALYYSFFLKFKSNLLVKRVFLLNAAFAVAVLEISCVHLTSFFQITSSYRCVNSDM